MWFYVAILLIRLPYPNIQKNAPEDSTKLCPFKQMFQEELCSIVIIEL